MTHILYTHNLRGDEAALTGLLPRLHTFLRSVKSQLEGPVYLLDAGRSCLPEVWPCSQTGGRSTLLALDAMGYHAASAAHLSPQDRERLLGNHPQMALVDDAHPWEGEHLYVTAGASPHSIPAHKLHVVLPPAQGTRIAGQRLRLAPLEYGQVGHAQVADGALRGWRVLSLPAATPPDPTIAGAVDFILSEARYYERRSRNGR